MACKHLKLVKDDDVPLVMPNTANKIVESTIRGRADKLGYRLIKSRKMNITPDDHGEYMVIEVSTRVPVFGFSYDASLSEVADFLGEDVTS